jgi:hypothetical protein
MRSKRAPDRDFGAAGHRRGTGTGKRLICAFVAAVAVVTLGLGISLDLHVESGLLAPGAVANAATADKQDMCLFHDLRRQLPKGATFYDSDASLSRFQRLAELATLWAVPEQTPSAARWRVAVVPGHCAQVGLKVWRA